MGDKRVVYKVMKLMLLTDVLLCVKAGTIICEHEKALAQKEISISDRENAVSKNLNIDELDDNQLLINTALALIKGSYGYMPDDAIIRSGENDTWIIFEKNGDNEIPIDILEGKNQELCNAVGCLQVSLSNSYNSEVVDNCSTNLENLIDGYNKSYASANRVIYN